MRRIFYTVLSTLSAVLLVGSYMLSLQQSAPPAPSSALGAGTAHPDPSAQSAAPLPDQGPVAPVAPGTSASSSAGAGAPALHDGDYTGAAAPTRYGAVQVAITVTDGRIADVQVPQYPDGGGREQRINTQAVPRLVDETIRAQSAAIDMVSGATYTMSGYLDSLQSALDQARS